MADHAGDVDEATVGADEGKEGACGVEGAVVIALEGGFDDVDVYGAEKLLKNISRTEFMDVTYRTPPWRFQRC